MNKITKIGTGLIYERDLTETWPGDVYDADCIYTNPPVTYPLLAAKYARAGVTMPAAFKTYDDYLDRFFAYIEASNPDTLYIETTGSNAGMIAARCTELYEYVDMDECYYNYRPHQECFVIRCGHDEPAPSPERVMDTRSYMRWICKNVNFSQIADLNTADIRLEFLAHKNGKKFCCITRDKKKINALKKMITEHDAKQAARERKKLAKQKIFKNNFI